MMFSFLRTQLWERMEGVSLEVPTEFPPQAAESRVPVSKRSSFSSSNYDMTESQGFSSRAPRSSPILTSSLRRERVGLTRGPWTTPMECTDLLLMRKLTYLLATTSRGATGEARGTRWRQQRWRNGIIWTKVNNLNKGEAMEWFEGLGRPQEKGNSSWEAAETEEDPILGLILNQLKSLNVHLEDWSDDTMHSKTMWSML